MAPRSSTLCVRAVANRASRRIIYLEADKGFVDMLLCFLQLPLAVVFRILSTEDCPVPPVGCISNAYHSLCSLLRPNRSCSADSSGLPYIVTDELEILQISNTMESVQLLSKLKVTNMANLRKLKTSISENEVLELFNCSLVSKVGLNTSFGAKVKCSPTYPDSMLCRNQLVKVDSRSIPVHFLVKRSSQRIVYMEVGDEFINVLESFLNTPVVWLLNKLSMGDFKRVPKVGSISKLYQSVSMLSQGIFLVPMNDMMNADLKKAKASPGVLISLLRAAASSVYACSQMHGVSFLYKDRCRLCNDDMTLELTILDKDVPLVMGRHVYRCDKSMERCACVSYTRSKWCTSCRESMNREIPIVLGGITEKWLSPPAQGFQGYVKRNLSFIVTDDLEILPASSLNNIALLNKAMVSRMENIHSLEVSISIREALELLKASFISGEALTTVLGEQIDQRMPQASRLDCECVDILLHWWNS